jgi:hypothetical protein
VATEPSNFTPRLTPTGISVELDQLNILPPMPPEIRIADILRHVTIRPVTFTHQSWRPSQGF